MSESDRERIKQLLSEAAKLSPELRRDFVIRSTADQPDLTSEALELLASLDNPRFMSAPTGAGFDARNGSASLYETPGARIGRYKLLQRIGEGGFGVVFMAEQVEPVVRRVALKIIKAGMDTRQVIARFEAERQALAMMDHPNIARVLDAGETDHGRPYFVMELVRGDPVTHYCDQEQLSLEDRLALFRDICYAVQHAHQKGIIHRDLKPSNVLVTLADGRPLPKVIDFGIAKATEVRLTDKTYFTELHQMVGTPEYMSPEQAEISGIDIDTRSDVYSLGVLLYELLAGGPPFDSHRLRSVPLAEIQRIIRDEEPPRPSTRLRTLADSSSIASFRRSKVLEQPSTDTIEMIAGRRRMEPMALTRSLRGDLDWMVMKCLEKDRARRYATANALAEDVSAFLSHQPVSATPPSRVYKVRKLFQRHRVAVAAGFAVGVTLIAATLVSIAFAYKASRALAAEEAQRALADQRARETKQVAAFQSDLLSGIDVEALGAGFKELFRKQVEDSLRRRFVGEWPDRRKLTDEEVDAQLAEYERIVGPVEGVDVARRVLDKHMLGTSPEVIETRFVDQPRVQAELLYTVGVILRKLGLNDEAESALRQAVALQKAGATDDEVELADSISELAAVVSAKGRSEEGERIRREALAIYERRLGKAHERTIISFNTIAIDRFNQGDMAEGEAMLREALAQARQLPPGQAPTLAQVLNDLGGALLARRETEESERCIREALEIRRRHLGDAHKEVGDSLLNLAGVYHNKGEYGEAEKWLREAIEVFRKSLGEEHVVVATCLNNLASTRLEFKDYASAITYFRESLDMYRRLLGDEHPDVTMTLNNLAMVYQMSGDLDAAEPLLFEALDLRKRQLGPDHPFVGLSLGNLGHQMLKRDDPGAAEPFFRDALEIIRKKGLFDQSIAFSPRLGLAHALVEQGKTDEAEEVLAAIDEKPGMDGLPQYLQGTYIGARVKVYEAKDRASPNQGFDKLAISWREKARPTSQPAAD